MFVLIPLVARAVLKLIRRRNAGDAATQPE